MKKFLSYVLALLAEILATAFLLTFGIVIAGAFGFEFNSIDDLDTALLIGALALLSSFAVMVAVKCIFAKVNSAESEPTQAAASADADADNTNDEDNQTDIRRE